MALMVGARASHHGFEIAERGYTIMDDGNGMGVVWALLAFAIMLPTLLLGAGLLFGGLRSAPARPDPRVPEIDAKQVLDARLARGDIELADYDQRLLALHATRR